MPSKSSNFVWLGSFYSALYNLLDYPCGVVPNVTQVSTSDGIPNSVRYSHMERSIDGNFNFLGVMALEEVNNCFVKGDIKDQSVGVQVVGRPFQEEKVLAAMKLIQSELSEPEFQL